MHIYYNAIFLPKVTSALPNSHFSEQELTKMQARAMSKIISKTGYSGCTAQQVLYDPESYGRAGAGFKHLHAEQGMLQTIPFIKTWQQTSQAS